MDSGQPKPNHDSNIILLHPFQPLPQAVSDAGCVLPFLFPQAQPSRYRRHFFFFFPILLQDLTIYLRKQILYPCFHPVFLWFANDMNFLSTKGRMSVGWRSQGGQGRLPVHFKGWVALGKDWQRVKFDSARRMLAMVNCTHSHLIMVCQDIWLEFV